MAGFALARSKMRGDSGFRHGAKPDYAHSTACGRERPFRIIGSHEIHSPLFDPYPGQACREAGITVTLPKPMTSNSKAEGRFGKQDFRYVAEEDVYICPAGEGLAYHYTNEENGLVLHRYWTNACQSSCTTGKERRITRWEHELVRW